MLAVAALLVAWHPWSIAHTNDSRTITVTGEAKLMAVPDEYVFTPSYEFKNADKAAALKDLTAKSNDIVAKLKALGVASDKIKTDSNGSDQGVYYYNYDQTDSAFTYTLNLTMTVNNAKLVQTVQDYLVTTSPSGSVSPSAQFSNTKQKQLESQARDRATKEARSKADQSAKNLGFTVSKVKSVDDSGFSNGSVMQPLLSQATNLDAGQPSSSLAVQPGQNELDYSVTVVYYLR